ncbi:MAG: AIR synthase related protein [Lachnospiraceae bacterium]|nr:AIR synthase related protein [Lachnospiraceae bacterium]
MKTGKISESILKRSVLKQIEKVHSEVLKGAGVGEDCAFLPWEKHDDNKDADSGGMAVSTQTVALGISDAAFLAVMAAANNLAAAGALARTVTLAVTLPEGAEEILLRELMEQALDCCRKLKIQIVGGHTEVSRSVRQPVVTATVIGEYQKNAVLKDAEKEKQAAGKTDVYSPAGLDIVVSKWIGMEGTSIIAKEKERELLKRFPPVLVKMAGEQREYLSVASEAATALKSGVYAMHDVRNGGIFGALWEISRKLGVGLCVDLKKIPVRQETIEICEFYNLNPYELISGGMLIMLTRDGQRLAEDLENKGINGIVIGSTNDGNDKIIVNQEEIRYLEPPVPDEINKLLFF